MQGIPPEAVEIAKLLLKFRKEEEERRRRGEVEFDPDDFQGDGVWIGVKELASILGKTRQAVFKKIWARKLPAKKVGRKLMVWVRGNAKEFVQREKRFLRTQVEIHISKDRAFSLVKAGLLSWEQVNRSGNVVFVGEVSFNRLVELLKKHFFFVTDHMNRELSRSEVEVHVKGEIRPLIGRGVLAYTEAEHCENGHVVFKGRIPWYLLIRLLKTNHFVPFPHVEAKFFYSERSNLEGSNLFIERR